MSAVSVTLLVLLGACHSGRSAGEDGKTAQHEQARREAATPPTPPSDPGPTNVSLPLLGGPADGDPVYFPIHPTSIIRLDRAGWTTIWRGGFGSTFQAIDGEFYVRRDEGVYRLARDQLLPVLMFDDAEPHLSDWPIPLVAVGPRGELWFADPREHGVVRVHAGASYLWPDPAHTGIEAGQLAGMTVDGQGRAWFPLTREWPLKYGIVHKHESGWWERVQGWEFDTQAPIRGWLPDAHGGLWLLAKDQLTHVTHEGIDARVSFGESADAQAIAVNGKRELVVQLADDTLLRYDADRLRAGSTGRDAALGCGHLYALDDRGRSWCARIPEALRVLAFDREGGRYEFVFEDRPPFHNWVAPFVVGPGPEQLPSGDAARFSLHVAEPERPTKVEVAAQPAPTTSPEPMFVSKLRQQVDPQQPQKFQRLNMPPVRTALRELPLPKHPPASELLLISADQPARWGQFRPGEVEYETWVARPGAPTVERRPGIFVSDGSQLWELRITARSVELQLCGCEEDTKPGTFRAEVTEVALRRADSDDWQVLFGPDRVACTEASENFREESYFVGVAGSRLLFVELSEYDFCDQPPARKVEFRIHDLAGGEVSVSELEQEFPAASIDDARSQASQHAADRGREGPGYWPHNLWLDAVFPKLDGPRFTAEIVFELRRDPDAGLGPRVELPRSSSLYPPPDMTALIEQARAEGEVIGWSRTTQARAAQITEHQPIEWVRKSKSR
ncbi:MAG: hypothetical protein R6X02_24975 [Enhygromyxa sp.]